MFGTIFHMKPKPGQQQAVIGIMDQWFKERGPKVQGALAGYVLKPEHASDQLVGVAVFQDRETYFKNAEDPAQDQWYQQLRALLDVDPVWEDGEIVSGGRIG